MKKKRMLICLVSLSVLVFIAGLLLVVRAYRDKQQNVLWSSDWEDSFCSQFRHNYMENGILYHSDFYIRFCDNASGEDNLICVDQSCSHKASQDSACGAYIDASIMGGVAIRGNHLMYVADSRDNYGICSLYAANLEGKERSKIDTLTKMDMICDVLYHENMVYVSYLVFPSDDEGDWIYGIYAYDLEQRKGFELYQEEGTTHTSDGMAMGEDVLYISYGYSDASKEDILAHREDMEFEKAHRQFCVKGLDPKSGEVKETLEGFGSGCVLLYVQGNLFYTKLRGEEEHEDLYIYSEAEGNSGLINDKDDLMALLGSQKGKAYFRGYNGETNEYLCFSYDIATGTWTEQNMGAFFPEGVSGGHIYGTDDSGPAGWLSVEDFEKGDVTKVQFYESQWETE